MPKATSSLVFVPLTVFEYVTRDILTVVEVCRICADDRAIRRGHIFNDHVPQTAIISMILRYQ